MSDNVHGKQLLVEEVKAVKLFLWMFYVIFTAYDLLIYYVKPLTIENPEEGPKSALGFWFFVLLFLLLPLAVYLIKKEKVYTVKYIYIIWYTLLDLLNMLLMYLGNRGNPFEYGSVLDVFLVLFAPIFVNKRYFWVVSISTTGKFLVSGLILLDKNTIIPVAIFVIISIVSFIMLTRFISYIQTLSTVYEDLNKKEKLAYVGKIATVIGHEIRNPLSALKGFIQLQSERDVSEDTYYPIMLQEIDRINTIVDDLMIIGRPKPPTFKQNNLNEIIQYISNVTSPLAENFGSKIVFKECEGMPLIECDEKQMKQVFINLIKNAVESLPRGGTVEVGCKVIGSDQIKIYVKDNGCGIDSEKLKKLGEPFYTTKPEGTGLGLMVSKKIIEDHLGELLFKSQLGKGTEVEIILPVKHN
ncbi:ATP-binding protein [Neobacillus sp. LXY-4]|uniref:ATP-binding protein n=1 Tax=Neobacillus sp. LXY-4 TaxID=3379826 RepID=UPI003EDFE63E